MNVRNKFVASNWALLAAAAGLLGLAGSAPADSMLYGWDTSDENLWSIDSAGPTSVMIGGGNIGIHSEIEYADGVIYGSDTGDNTNLHMIDPATGLIFDTITMSFPPEGDVITSMEYVGGTMYAGLTTEGGGPTYLSTIDLGSGAVTVIGPTGFGSPFGGLAYDAGVMYGISAGGSAAELFTVDLATGAATSVGMVSLGGGITALEFGTDGVLYAAPNGNSSLYGHLLTIDPTNANAVDLGDTGVPGLVALTSTYAPAPPCPADINLDGNVDVLDLLAVLAAWGNPGGPEDVNGDGVVDVLDLLELLSAWGPCCEYCDVCYPNQTDDWITNVSFGDIDNDSGQDGPCSYGDYTNLSTDVAIGETYTLSVSFFSEGTWTECVSAWIDWNHNCEFDADERYDLGCGIDATVTTNIIIPPDALLGATRLRVIEEWDVPPADACAGEEYGETEDYTINVLPPLPYCDANGGCDEHISLVEVGAISNASGCDGYADYTSLSTPIALGQPVSCIVTNGDPYSDDYFGAWADWNHDGDFDDAGETIAPGIPGTGPYTFIITPPTFSYIGHVRMRLRIVYDVAPTPCGDHTYGEVEDYTIQVTP